MIISDIATSPLLERYLDAAFATERGRPYRVRNAVCIHEEDSGVARRHTDIGAGTNEVRRGRRLVVSSFATAGNYDYGFFWYFFLDGTIECEVKLTGIVSTEAVAEDRPLTHATRVSEHLAAPNHQHIFNARLHFEVDGPCNSVFEVDAVTDEAAEGNEWGGTFRARATPLEREHEAQRLTHPAAGRVWKVTNPCVLNAWGDPVAYKLVPGPTPTLMARPDSSVARRAAFATRNLWVTPYAPDERRAAGEYPNQHVAGTGSPDGRRPTDPSSRRSWFSGTPLASPISHDRRTSRSCRSNGPASPCCPRDSSITTQPLTCRPPACCWAPAGHGGRHRYRAR